MKFRTAFTAIAALLAAAPLTAQQRGTVEFGAFAGSTNYGSGLSMNSGWGGGGRVGLFLAPRVSVEFEAGADHSAATLGLRSANVETLAARLTAVALQAGRASLHLGAGVDHTDTYALESFGLQGLAGAKYMLTERVALRLDAIESYMLTGKHWNFGLRTGISFYLNPNGNRSTVTTNRTVATRPQRPDSVSAAETARLRTIAAQYVALRDSMARMPATSRAASSAPALATMQEMIYFQNDRSELSEAAKTTLRAKLAIFELNPAMRIVIVGFASRPGTDQYNMALGLRRAEAAKSYLVSQGVEPIRIEIATRGEGQLVMEGVGERADAANRRDEFQLQVADSYLIEP